MLQKRSTNTAVSLAVIVLVVVAVVVKFVSRCSIRL